MPISTHLGEEQLWSIFGLKSKSLFVLPPLHFHQFRKLILLFEKHIECVRRWAALVLTNAKCYLCWARLCFALSQRRVLRRDAGPNGTKRSWTSRLIFNMIPFVIHVGHLWYWGPVDTVSSTQKPLYVSFSITPCWFEWIFCKYFGCDKIHLRGRMGALIQWCEVIDAQNAAAILWEDKVEGG